MCPKIFLAIFVPSKRPPPVPEVRARLLPEKSDRVQALIAFWLLRIGYLRPAN